MVTYDKVVVRENMMKMYDRKINKVLTTSIQYSVYCKLYAELSTFGVEEALMLAEREIKRPGIKVSAQKCYTQFCINFQRLV